MIERGKQSFLGVLDIPERKVGDFEIRHIEAEGGHCFDIGTARMRALGGLRGGSVHYDFKTRWHELLEKGRRWMSDTPIEQASHDELLSPIRSGSVLIGGLGLGYAAFVLALRRSISKITIVERSPEVIELVEESLRRRIRIAGCPLIPSRVEIVQCCIHEYLQEAQRARYRRGRSGAARFSWAFYDTWASDGEGTFFDEVVPLIRASQGVVRKSPLCWNEAVMRGQLRLQLLGKIMLSKPGDAEPLPEGNPSARFHNWAVPFFEWMRKEEPDEVISHRAAAWYSGAYATWGWEKDWELFKESVHDPGAKARKGAKR